MFRLCRLLTFRLEMLFRFRYPLFGFLLAALKKLNPLAPVGYGWRQLPGHKQELGAAVVVQRDHTRPGSAIYVDFRGGGRRCRFPR